MAFTLRMQDPGSAAETLLELLLDSATCAERGGAAFSFVTARGVRLLFGDPGFSNFLSRRPFKMIVGLDAVTVPEALAVLHEAGTNHPLLTVRAFLHGRPRTLFHPKFAWFGMKRGARVLVGSGNLTRGGLLKNWEAVGDATLGEADARSVIGCWQGWVADNASNLFAVTDEGIVARAEKNKVDFHRLYDEDRMEEEDKVLDSVEPDSAVLIVEIPRGAERWQQANFHRETFDNFFQARPSFHRLLLFPVDEAGAVGDPEVRQGVSVKSRNFRIELGQAAGREYPDESDGRPIGLFLRLGTRRFRYRLLMPGENDYGAIDAILADQYAGRPDRMREVRLSLEEFRAAAPDTSL